MLVGGSLPDDLGVAAVVVSDDRAELPSPKRLQRTLSQIGERCLLNGHRRVVLVGFPPRWHRVLRQGLDARVELAFRPTATATPDERVDAFVHWSEPGAGPPKRKERPHGLAAVLDRWLATLAP